MRGSCRSVLALLVGLAVAGTAALSPVTAVRAAGAGSISGTVAAPGGPAADVTVNLFAWNPDEANWDFLDSTLTDAQGDYSLSGLDQADHRLEFVDYSGALASEFYDDARDLASATDVPVGADQAVVGIDATLVPAGHVAGTVTGAEGEPLSGIFVTAWAWDDAGGYWTSVYNDWSEVDGSYDVGNLPPDSYRIGFTDFDGNHVTEYWDDQPELALADPVVVAVGATVPGRDASLAESGHITGTVTGDGAGPPLHGVSVTAYAYDAEEGYWEPVVWTATMSDGSYDLAELPPGTYRVGFEDLAGAFVDEYWDDQATVTAATDIVVAGGATTGGRNAALAAAPAATAYENTALPTIGGAPQVGQALTASPGSWTPSGATYGYEWLAEGAAIPGATAPTLTLTDGLVGKRISVRVTAFGGLPAAGAATSAQTAPVAAAPVVALPPTPPPTPTPVIDNVTLPKIKGTPKVGKVLKVTHGSWSPSTVTLRYQWLANGTKIRKATKARFTLTRAQLGAKIRVRVTALLAGATNVVVTTRPTAKIKA